MKEERRKDAPDKRDPGYYVVRVRGDDNFGVGELMGDMVYFALSEQCGIEHVETWGPRILPDPTLVQVPKAEFEAMHALTGWLLDGMGRHLLNRLDSLRRREGESDEA